MRHQHTESWPHVQGSRLPLRVRHSAQNLTDAGRSGAGLRVSTPVEKVTNVAGENVTPGGGDEPLVRRLLLCSCSLSLGG